MLGRYRESLGHFTPPAVGLEEKQQRQIFVLFVGLSIVGLIGFGVSHFFLERSFQGVMNLVVSGLFAVLLFIPKRWGKTHATHRIFIFFVLVLFLYWVRAGGTQGQPTAAMWIYVFPLLSLFLLGKMEGLLWTGALVVGILVQFLLPDHLMDFVYVTEFKIRFLGSLVLVTILAHNYEAIRAAYWKRIMRHHDNLEALVTQRTSQLQSSNFELRKSEHRYRILTDNASDLIWKADNALKLNFVSPSVEQLCGYTVAQALERPLSEWFSPESFQKLYRSCEELIGAENSCETIDDRSLTLELQQYRKDGTSFPVELRLSPVREESPVAIGILGISRDITERKERQELLIQTEKMKSLSGLAAGMAHEINNPLAGTLHSIQLIRSRYLIDSPENRSIASSHDTTLESIFGYLDQRGVTTMLGSASELSERLATIVRTMLSFSRNSEGHFSMHSVGELLDNTIVLASTDFDLNKDNDFSKIDIVRNYDGQVPKVPCDPVKLQQVFFNILKNGAEAMREKEYKEGGPRFVLSVTHREETVTVEIEDNGPGLDQETRGRIFDPFFTTKSAGRGTGLGLSLSYFIVTQNHGGQMALETEKDKRTKIVIRLPIVRSGQS